MSAPADALARRAQQFIDFSPDFQKSKSVGFQDEVHMTTTQPSSTDMRVSALADQLSALREDLSNLKLQSDPQVQFTATPPASDRPTFSQDHRSRRNDTPTRRPRSSSRDRGANGRYHGGTRHDSRSPSRHRHSSPFQAPHHSHSDRSRRQQQHRQLCHFCGRPNHLWRDCFQFKELMAASGHNAPLPLRPPSNYPSYHNYQRRPDYQYQPPRNNWDTENNSMPNAQPYPYNTQNQNF